METYLVESPFLAFFILSGIISLLYSIFYQLPKRMIRHFDIKKNGWPPNHCDVDGDFKKEQQND